MVLEKRTPAFIEGIIIDNVHLKNDYYRIIIDSPQIAQNAKPGQFVMLSKWHIKELLLKRPFSFYNIEPDQGQFSLLYKKVGKGTEKMAEAKKGELVELIGPLGNSFIIPEKVKNIAIVARGIGVVPMMPLVNKAKKEDIGIYSFLSARKSELLLCDDNMESICKDTFYTTDDSSKGCPGNVTVFLEDFLKKAPNGIDAVYTCGSKRLARHIRDLQKKYNFHAYISLEERMGCGIGSCKGCVVQTKHGYQRACKEGPVFPLEEVVLDER